MLGNFLAGFIESCCVYGIKIRYFAGATCLIEKGFTDDMSIRSPRMRDSRSGLTH
jgi:hypothetical protein